MMAVMTAEPELIGLPSSEKLTVGKNWLTISEGTTELELWAVVSRLAMMHRSCQLWIGDAICFGERKGFYADPKTYDQLEAVTGLKRGTLQQYKSVAERTSCTRVQDLDYAHHREVAPLPQEEQRVILQKAAEGRWTIQQLRREIRKASPSVQEDDLRVIQDVNKRLEDEKEVLDTEVTTLLDRINKLPRPYRLKIIKAIER